MMLPLIRNFVLCVCCLRLSQLFPHPLDLQRSQHTAGYEQQGDPKRKATVVAGLRTFGLAAAGVGRL